MEDEDGRTVVLAHWYQRFDWFSISTQTFYERLCAEIARRKMPDVQLLRVDLPQGGFLAGKRDYLRINRGKHSFTLCAAPFGIDFFVSWWLLEAPGCLSGCLTVLVPPLALFARQATFYEEDTAAVFRDCVHEAVLKVIDDIYTGLDKKPDFDRKPMTRNRMLS
jgi:hypothetical protein